MHDLISNISQLHTTDMGAVRVRRNLGLVTDDIVPVIRKHILLPDADIMRRGKNWYITTPEYIITVNAYSFTIITARKVNYLLQRGKSVIKCQNREGIKQKVM